MAIRMMNISSSGCLMPAGRNLGSTSSYTHEKGLNQKNQNIFACTKKIEASAAHLAANLIKYRLAMSSAMKTEPVNSVHGCFPVRACQNQNY